VGPDKPDDLVTSRDVHLAAGLLCVDCHREELVHLTTRGYATEAAERKADCLATFSCEGCHLGTDARAGEEEKDAATAAPPAEEAADAAVRLGGRYGAPHPQHRGLPLVHFEKLTCTACHSGPWPETDAKQFQTAMAHGLGLATRDREDTDPPLIVGPIFAKQPDGKVAPQRMVWPAFWGRLAGDGVTPIPLDVVRKLASKGLPKTTGKVTTRPTRLSTDQIARILESLAAQKDGAGTPVYVQDGRLYRRAADGKLEFVASTAAAPVRWSLAHDVRPASESLGIRGCNDCHANDAPLFFGRVAMAGQTGVPTSQPMVVFRGDEEGIARAWALGFIVRPEFKVLGFLCAALITLLVLRYGTQGFRGESDARRGFTRYEHFLHLLVVVGVLIQAITGFVGKYIVGELDEWLLFVHMLGAPLFIVGLTGSALHWSPRCRFTPAGRVSISGLSPSQKFLFWVTLVVGLLTMLPMLAAMVPLFGYADQETLTAIHADAALALVLVMAVLIMTSIRPTRLPKEVKQP
jgi:hypothetical protein